MNDWQIRMDRLVESSAFLNKLNVLEVAFDNGSVLDLYVAVNPQERARGLSHVEALDTDGMLFYYDKPSFVPFTTEEMLIPINIAWYDAKGNLIKYGTWDNSHKGPIFSPQAFSYVIETPAGILPEANLKVKDRNG
jgi:uncharacterized membrane protein (UPF0127 family)